MVLVSIAVLVVELEPLLIKIYHIHCIAHKLELAVLDACKQVAYIEKFQTTIKSLLKYYSQSSKWLNELAEVGKVFKSTVFSLENGIL